MTMSPVNSCCTPALNPSVCGVSKLSATAVGRGCAGMITLVNKPVGPKMKYPAGWPMAALAWSAYCCGVNPVRV